MIGEAAWERFARTVEERLYDMETLSPGEIAGITQAITEDAKEFFESQICGPADHI